MFNKEELLKKYDGAKITKSKKWVEKHDPELIEIFECDFDKMTYYFASDGLRYLPNGEEPFPIKVDSYSDFTLKNLRFLPEIEDTEGFEPFKDELIDYRKTVEREVKEKREKREKELDQKANELGLEGLYRLILRQEEEIEKLQNKLDRKLIV